MPNTHIGDRHGRLTLLEFIPGGKHPKVRCRCDCGTEKVIQRDNLGRTHSCGCIKREMLQAKATHGMSQSPEFRIWADMRQRCQNPSNYRFPEWGGRGVTVCGRWDASFSAFYADMGQRPSSRHSIDRIDNNGHYEPTNCRWATAKQQRENQRRTKMYTFNGMTGTLKDLARHAGIRYSAVHQRVTKMQWPLDKALTKPSQRP
jgi:hypothetical protein